MTTFNCDIEQKPNLTTLICTVEEHCAPLVIEMGLESQEAKAKDMKVILMSHS